MTTTGTHIILDIEWCKNEKALAEFYFKKELLKVVRKNKMTPIGVIEKKFKEKFWHRKGYSYTALIGLEESHISIHTFPLEAEKKKVAIDIYTCNFSRDNKLGTERIADFLLTKFQPAHISNHLILSR